PLVFTIEAAGRKPSGSESFGETPEGLRPAATKPCALPKLLIPTTAQSSVARSSPFLHRWESNSASRSHCSPHLTVLGVQRPVFSSILKLEKRGPASPKSAKGPFGIVN